MTSFLKLLIVTSVSFGFSTSAALAEVRSVGPAIWQTEEAAQIKTVIPNNMSQFVFVRFADNLPTETNINVSIDDDYQISLGSNHMTHIMVCQGQHELSSQSTAHKSNNLLYKPKFVNSEPGKTYYYQLHFDANNNTVIRPLSPTTKVDGKLLPDYATSMPKQAHQISRVIQDCSKSIFIPKPIVKVTPAPRLIKPTPVVVKPMPKPDPITFDKPIELDVLFKTDSATVVPQYYARISEMAEFIKQHDATAIIEGHTDAIGSEQYNMSLSQQRADAVKALLVIQYGVNPAKLSTQGFGETHPVASNDTESGRLQNRRVMAIAHRNK